MPYYVVKNQEGTFHAGSQPDGFATAHGAIENRLFICVCPTVPNGEFVVEIPNEQLDNFRFYPYSNGKKLPFDIWNGEVKFGEEVDNKRRRVIMYTDEQLAKRLSIQKWLMLNVWIPDKARMYNIDQNIVDGYIAAVDALQDDEAARIHIIKNLHYNL